MHGMWLAGNTRRKNDAKNCHLRTVTQLRRAVSSQRRHVLTIGKKSLTSSISSTCPHNGVNVGPLTAEICWRVWGTPANFKGFRVLPLLLQRRRSTEVNQTLQDVWPSLGLVHYICILGGSCPLTEFCKVQNSFCIQVFVFSYIGSVTARHSSSGHQPNFEALSRGRHLHLAGRPSRWASAHVLVGNHFGG